MHGAALRIFEVMQVVQLFRSRSEDEVPENSGGSLRASSSHWIAASIVSFALFSHYNGAKVARLVRRVPRAYSCPLETRCNRVGAAKRDDSCRVHWVIRASRKRPLHAANDRTKVDSHESVRGAYGTATEPRTQSL